LAESVIEKLRSALAGRYDLEREIGRGGMATVFLARDLENDRNVAIKVLNSDLSVAMGPERFRREIDVANTLAHPSILPVYDSGESNGSLYYVMPFVAGESLAARLERERQLSVDEALRITCEVAGAIDYAHKRGIVHRDIKPENILLEDGKVLVADFGIARAISATGDQKLTQTGLALGTPTYMSPEQAMGEKNIDGRSDVYSLGCVLYEMLIGQPPFVGPTAQAIIARQMLDEVPSLTVVRGAIPDELEDAVLRALSKVPADRFATAGEFADALQACRASGGKSLGRAERRGRPRRTTRQAQGRSRNRLFIIAGAAVLLVAGVGGFLLTRGGSADASGGALLPQRVAVLYFSDDSPGERLRHVADGLTESLIDELGDVSRLTVISPNGVEQFRNTTLRLDSVGRALAVGTVISGRVEEVGRDSLRVYVQVVNGNTGDPVERASFDQPRGDLLALRDTLSRKAAEMIRRRVGQEVVLREQRGETRSAEAWALLQRAQQIRKDGEAKLRANDSTAGRAQLRSADSLLTLAEEQDPRWPEPIVTRGWLAADQVRLTREQLRQAQLVDTGLAHAARALSLNPRNSGALELRGTLYYLKWRQHLTTDPVELSRLLGQAETDLRSVVTMEPSRASAWSTLSLVYSEKPDFIEAAIARRRAYEADAYLSNADEIVWGLYATAYDNEQFLDAVKWCNEGRRRFPQDPNFVRCQLWLYTTSAVTPTIPEAWATAQRFVEISPERARPLREREAQMLVAMAIHKAGNTDSAKKVLERARGNPQLDPERELVSYEAFIRAQMGDVDTALDLIKQYLAAKPEHREGLAQSQSWWWRNIKTDPRFRELVGAGS
jgi:TolB-like protein